MVSKNVFGQGYVHHSRHQGAKNSFRYPSFFLLTRCEDDALLQRELRVQFKGLLSLRPQDYLLGKPGNFTENINSFLAAFCDYRADEVWLHTLPRMFGYAFNPVSFWLCKKKDQLDAVLVEVNNTFGEKHFYWIHPDKPISSDAWLRAEKVFHVSPFFPVEGHYLFRFQITSQDSRIDINYHGPDDLLRLATWVEGQLHPLQSIGIWKLLFRYGWLTPMITLRIHSQALRLWLKKVRFYKKPSPPIKNITP